MTVCPTFTRRRLGNSVHMDDSIVVSPAVSDVVEDVETFDYSEGFVDSRKGGVERVVRARVVIACTKWREIPVLLINRQIPLKNRVNICVACICSILLLCAVSWPHTQRPENCTLSCDRRLLRSLDVVTSE